MTNLIEIVRIEVYSYLEEIGIEDVDDYLFLLFSLQSESRKSGLLVLPVYSPVSGQSALQKNFESVFKWMKNEKISQTDSELGETLEQQMGQKKMILSFVEGKREAFEGESQILKIFSKIKKEKRKIRLDANDLMLKTRELAEEAEKLDDFRDEVGLARFMDKIQHQLDELVRFKELGNSEDKKVLKEFEEYLMNIYHHLNQKFEDEKQKIQKNELKNLSNGTPNKLESVKNEILIYSPENEMKGNSKNENSSNSRNNDFTSEKSDQNINNLCVTSGKKNKQLKFENRRSNVTFSEQSDFEEPTLNQKNNLQKENSQSFANKTKNISGNRNEINLSVSESETDHTNLQRKVNMKIKKQKSDFLQSQPIKRYNPSNLREDYFSKTMQLEPSKNIFEIGISQDNNIDLISSQSFADNLEKTKIKKVTANILKHKEKYKQQKYLDRHKINLLKGKIFYFKINIDYNQRKFRTPKNKFRETANDSEKDFKRKRRIANTK